MSLKNVQAWVYHNRSQFVFFYCNQINNQTNQSEIKQRETPFYALIYEKFPFKKLMIEPFGQAFL